VVAYPLVEPPRIDHEVIQSALGGNCAASAAAIRRAGNG
jgi:hypothetical protein